MSETIQTKTCINCKRIKPTSEFYKTRRHKDGLHSGCKECASLYQKKYRRTAKGKQTNRQGNKKYRRTEKGRQAHKLYGQSEKGKQASKEYRKHNTDKSRAQRTVNDAIARKDMPKPTLFQCSCGKQAQQYHHPDYAPEHWLDVVSVCRSCHYKIHKELCDSELQTPAFLPFPNTLS